MYDSTPSSPPSIGFEGQVQAIESVNRLLKTTTTALDAATIDYAVIGGFAVAAWVATIDAGGVRATKNVDLLMKRQDWSRASDVLLDHDLVPVEIHGVHMFLDAKNPNPKTSVHVVMAGELVRPHEAHPAPDLDSRQLFDSGYYVIGLPELVEMKLQAHRRVDQLHIEDMLRTGVIRQALADRLPQDLRARLEHIRATM